MLRLIVYFGPRNHQELEPRMDKIRVLKPNIHLGGEEHFYPVRGSLDIQSGSLIPFSDVLCAGGGFPT